MIKRSLIQPRSLLLIFIAVMIIVVAAVFSELQQSRKEVLNILESQAHSLLETVLISSQEVWLASGELENEIDKRLLNNASIVNILLEQHKINNSILKEIAEKNDLSRINIFDSTGRLIYSNLEKNRTGPTGKYARDFLVPIFNGSQDTLILGLRETMQKNGFRYVAAVATESRGAIVLNLDAEKLLEFRQRIGLGVLLNKLTDYEGVIFTALSDSSGILAASSNVQTLDNITDSEFLAESVNKHLFQWRFTDFNGEEIFEAVHDFELEGEVVGLFRVGLSLKPLHSVYDRITTRIIISGLLLLVLGTFLMGVVFARQNFITLKKQYDYIEGFSNQLIKNVNDTIIVLDEEKKIKDINPAGLKFFKKSEDEVITLSLNELLCDEAESKIFLSSSNTIETICEKNGDKKYLLMSRSEFKDSNNKNNFVLIIKDLTSLKELEEQVERGKQLTAMGHLASGVAHEIRNPLNTIGTIVQQLQRDFEPRQDADDYNAFTELVYKEVKRINKTIENFLKLAKPEPMNKKRFLLPNFLNEIFIQHDKILKEKNINFLLENDFDGEVFWDEDQMRQVLLNLISNARDSIENNGTIKITSKLVNSYINIEIQDDGKGIPGENLNKIFNLYFTTKADGTGVGLGITQRIINEHQGIITVDSKENRGTKFTIKLKAGIEETTK
ncbi:MAG: ATP-binding protein [Ignavibacteria bacterium]|jgi:PAS domain S-box-containing protein